MLNPAELKHLTASPAVAAQLPIIAEFPAARRPARPLARLVEISLQPSGIEYPAILAHELRNPLASIHYALKLLGSPAITAEQRPKIQTLLERQVRQMTQLVDDLVDASRIATGRLQLQRERIDLRTIIEHAAETLEPQVTDRQHRLTVKFPIESVWLWADPGRLEQIFVNLLANACKYTDAGGQLTVSVKIRERQAIVYVQDNGIGIARESLPHIFGLFRQADTIGARSRSGLGIGLAVVRHLVELHGGRVTASSAGTGHGSEFMVRLPIER